jgi:hypothetical protein
MTTSPQLTIFLGFLLKSRHQLYPTSIPAIFMWQHPPEPISHVWVGFVCFIKVPQCSLHLGKFDFELEEDAIVAVLEPSEYSEVVIASNKRC